MAGYNSNMTTRRQIIKAVTKRSLHDQESDLSYWQMQPMQARIDALEEIRKEFHQWKYSAQPRLQRVHRILDLKALGDD